MARKRLDSSSATLVLVLLVAGVVGHGQPTQRPERAQQKSTPPIAQETAPPVPGELPEPSDASAREARRAKGVRYNTGGRDLTTLGPHGDVITDVFIEDIWPSVKFIPTDESSAIVTGTVIGVQAYLSEDRSQVYTEITIAVDEFIKMRRGNALLGPSVIVIDWPGGPLRLKSGWVVHGSPHVCYLGEPLTGKRYVFFAESIHHGLDLSLIKTYELRDGKVFTNNSIKSVEISTMPGVPAELGDESVFLAAVRDEARRRIRLRK